MPDAPIAAPTAASNSTGDQGTLGASGAQAVSTQHLPRRQLGQPQSVVRRQPSRENVPIAAALPKLEPPAAPATVTPAAGAAADIPPVVDGSAPAATTEPATEPEKISAAEESKRLAHINRASQKLQAERRAFAQERQQHTQNLQRAQALEQHFQRGAQEAQADPLAFMQRTFGISPQAILDRVITEGAKPDATRAQEAAARQAAEFQAKIAGLESEMQRAAKENEQRRTAQETEQYKRSTIAPVVADAAKYPLLHAYCRGTGADAVNEVWNGIETRWRATNGKEILTPAQVADTFEKHLRSQRDLLTGANVAPARLTAPPRIDPAKATANGSQTQNRTGGVYASPQKSFKIRAKT